MGRYFILAIMLYLLVIAIYLLWERSVKRKQNAGKKKGFNPFKSSPKEDIMGKSKFILRQSRPQATTLIQSEKGIEKESTFADGNDKTAEETTPAVIPPSRLEEVFTSGPADDDSGENEMKIDYEPEGEFEPEDEYEDDKDYEESEYADESAGVTSVAQGLKFDEMSGMLQTVENHEMASIEEKKEAGRVVIELRNTDMFEQIVSGEPKKKIVVTEFINDYLAAFHRRKQEESGEINEPIVRAPKDFDMSAFT